MDSQPVDEGLRVKLWRIVDEQPKEVEEKREVELESRLEKWIEYDPSIINPDLLLIGKQVMGIDLLFLDKDGNIVAAELKRGRTPRQVIAQILDYGSRIKALKYEDIEAIASRYYGETISLEEKFRERFGVELPDELGTNHKLLIVATYIDETTRRIVQYLADYGIPINVITFQYFVDEHGGYIARTFPIVSPSPPPPSQEDVERIYEEYGLDELFKRIKDVSDRYPDVELKIRKKEFHLVLTEGKINFTLQINPEGYHGVWVADPSLFEPVAEVGRRLRFETKVPIGKAFGKVIIFNHLEGLRKLNRQFDLLFNQLRKILYERATPRSLSAD